MAVVTYPIDPDTTLTGRLGDVLGSHGNEIVLFVGCPGLGKTSFYQRHFAPCGYVHVNQDTLKRRDKCIQLAEDAIRKSTSCVVGQSTTTLTRSPE